MHQSNGPVECMNRTIVDHIRKLCFAKGGSWVDYIPRAVNAMNFVVHSIIASSREKKFVPQWKGPYILSERVSPSLWKAKKVPLSGSKKGCQPVGIYHEN